MASNLKKITMVMVGILTFFLFNNTVSARELDITPDMTQEEIDAVLILLPHKTTLQLLVEITVQKKMVKTIIK